MKNFFKKYWLIIFSALFSLIPVTWTAFDQILAGGDDNDYLNPLFFFKFTTWNNHGYYSSFNDFMARIFPFGFFWELFHKIGLDGAATEKIFLWTMWFAGCLSLIYLIKVIFPRDHRIIAFFAVIFYYLNPFTFSIPLTVPIFFAHTFLPLALAFFIQGIRSDTHEKRLLYAVFFGLTTLLSAPVFASPPNAVSYLLIPFLYFLFYVYQNGLGEIFPRILFAIEAMVFFLLFNLYYLWSTVYIWFYGNSSNIVTSLGTQIFKTTSVFDVFRTLGGWAFASNQYKTYEAVYYTNFAFVFFSYLLVLIIFSSLFYIKKNKNVLFLLFTTVIFIFLIKGTLAPLGGWFQYAFDNFSFFKGFREPWTKFSSPYVLCLSLLFGYACYKIWKYLEGFETKIWTMIYAILILLALFVTGYPGITGDTNWDYNMPGAKSTHVKIPDYWLDMNKWLAVNDPDSPVLVTPKNLSARDYKWPSGVSSSAPLESLFLHNPMRFTNYKADFGVPEFDGFFVLFNSLHDINTDNFYNFLSMLGIKYIIQENDVYWSSGWGTYSPEIMKEVLSNRDFLEKYKTFGPIDIYRVKENWQKPIIYPSQRIILSNGPAYAFSSWNRREMDNFSLIEQKDQNFKTDGLKTANQILSGNNSNGDTAAVEKNFNFNVEREGAYDVVMKVVDTGKMDEIPISYEVNDNAWQDKDIKIERNQVIKKSLDSIGYAQVFSDIDLGNANFKAGANNLKIKSDAFKDQNFGGITYVVLNKYFSDSGEKSSVPEIKINKTDDAKYILDVKNSQANPYILNFTSNFDKDWQLYLLEGSGQISLDVPHFKINGATGNGWYINPNAVQNKDNYKLVIEYRPQRYFSWFLWISILSIATGVSIALILIRRKND